MFETVRSYAEIASISLPFTILAAFGLDLLLGDPQDWPHMIRWVGRGITAIDARFNRAEDPQRQRLGRGILLAFVYPSLIALALSALLQFFFRLSLPLYFFFRVLAAWQLLAVKDLAYEAGEVAKALREKGLPAARARLSRIVGRDTAELGESDCCKAVVETVAENFSDGIVAPLLFLLLFDVPGMIFYKVVNTLDSMVAYRNKRYEYFGKASAKLDDILNYFPSRIAALILLLASLITGLDAREGWRVFRRDRNKHPSPNSAQTEAVAAGAMHLKLGGPSVYGGILLEKPALGDDRRKADANDIDTVIRLLRTGAVISVALAFLLAYGRSFL